MSGWIVTILLYAVGIGFFHLIGGVGAAAGAIQRWGRHSSARRIERKGVPDLGRAQRTRSR